MDTSSSASLTLALSFLDTVHLIQVAFVPLSSTTTDGGFARSYIMKVSVLTMLAVAALATASPVCDNVDVGFNSHDLTLYQKKCLRECHPMKPKCPGGFRPRRIGWRCCKGRVSAEDDDEYDELDEFD
jgi:hypothetical protein